MGMGGGGMGGGGAERRDVDIKTGRGHCMHKEEVK